jgi:predicted nuclease of predicted toxin-antitoxin system
VKLLIDMNLTPEWVGFLSARGFDAHHWSDLGDPRAPDAAIMEYARDHGFVVFTHDLDFGNILAATNARGPSVIQVRTQDPTPQVIGEIVISALRNLRSQLERGALVTLELAKMRSRVLPLFPSEG